MLRRPYGRTGLAVPVLGFGAMQVSRLDRIQGIGPARRKALLNHFGSIEDIQNASIEELSAVPGITTTVAQAIKAQLE